MSIAADANASGTSIGTTNTWSHTVGSGSDRVLFVGISGKGTDPNDTTGITYGGVALLRISAFRAPATGLPWLELWQLTNPSTGTANVVVSYGVLNVHSGVSVSYSGVIQWGWFDLFGNDSEDGSSDLNISITSILENSWLMTAVGTVTTAALSYTNLTEIKRDSAVAMADSAGTVSPGSHSLKVTTNFVDLLAITLVLEPSGGPSRVIFPLIGMDI